MNGNFVRVVSINVWNWRYGGAEQLTRLQIVEMESIHASTAKPC